MKYIILIADGCADFPQQALSGRTPLKAAQKKNLDALAARGTVGTARTIPVGVAPGSDTAILSIFGYDPTVYYTGRSPLEAAGSGVTLAPGNLSFRLNLAGVEGDEDFSGAVMRSHSGGNVEGEDALALMQSLLADPAVKEWMARAKMTVQVSPTFRHVAVMQESPGELVTTPPHEIIGRAIGEYLPTGAGDIRRFMELSYQALRHHPVNQRRVADGKLAANCAWPWGEGTAIQLPSFTRKYGKTAAVVTAVPLVRGIANLAGMQVAHVPTATGDIDTDYEGKADAAARALASGADCVVIHVEAPDECSHDGSLSGKLEAIRRIDERLLPRLLGQIQGPYRLLALSDHYTLLSTRGHDATPVPYLLYDSTKDTRSNQTFDEQSALNGPAIDPGTELMGVLFGG